MYIILIALNIHKILIVSSMDKILVQHSHPIQPCFMTRSLLFSTHEREIKLLLLEFHFNSEGNSIDYRHNVIKCSTIAETTQY